MRTRREAAPPITAATAITADDGPRPEKRTVRGTR